MFVFSSPCMQVKESRRRYMEGVSQGRDCPSYLIPLAPIACPLLQNSNRKIQCSKCLFKVQYVHSKFKKFIQNSKRLFKVQNVYSKFKMFIQSSKCSFKVQKVYSKFKMFIQSSKSVFKAQNVFSIFKSLFNVQKTPTLKYRKNGGEVIMIRGLEMIQYNNNRGWE